MVAAVAAENFSDYRGDREEEERHLKKLTGRRTPWGRSSREETPKLQWLPLSAVSRILSLTAWHPSSATAFHSNCCVLC
jgi:hypothetical protein